MQIAVIEDEVAIADFLERGLRAEGFVVRVASDGIEGERAALDADVDLLVLDRMLPGRDGDQVLAAVRRTRPALPVIMLTARAEVADRVEGLENGATDYLTKPFAFAELLARFRARLRDDGSRSETTIEAAGLRLNLLTRELRWKDAEGVRLPEREASLLAHLMRHGDRICRREEILSAVWDYDHDPGTNVVQVYVGYLRRRLDRPDCPASIETVRGVGYRLRLAQ
jgi:DNA-binding response OmpR family regulator